MNITFSFFLYITEFKNKTMSYDLIYAKQFIKIETKSEPKFIPIVLAGSSNCYEVVARGRNGKERRSRSWFDLKSFTAKSVFATEKEMLENIYAERQRMIDRNNERCIENPEHCDKYDDKHFGYFASLSIGGRHTSTTTFGMYKGLITTGVKKALTVEQLKEFCLGVHLSVFSTKFDKESEEKASEINKNLGTVDTTEELLISIEYYQNLKLDFLSLTVRLDAINDKKALNRVLLHYFPKKRKEKQAVTLENYFVIKTPQGYFDRMLPRGYRYLYTKYGAKVFETLPKAQKYIDKLADKGYKAKVEEIKEQITIHK